MPAPNLATIGCAAFYSETAIGSACLMDDAWILTAKHVVTNQHLCCSRQLCFNFFDGNNNSRKTFALAPYSDGNYLELPELDIALVKLRKDRHDKLPTDYGFLPLTFSALTLDHCLTTPNIELHAFGHPKEYAEGWRKKTYSGASIAHSPDVDKKIANIVPNEPESVRMRWLLTDIKDAVDGFSGGPIVDESGKLVAITLQNLVPNIGVVRGQHVEAIRAKLPKRTFPWE